MGGCVIGKLLCAERTASVDGEVGISLESGAFASDRLSASLTVMMEVGGTDCGG